MKKHLRTMLFGLTWALLAGCAAPSVQNGHVHETGQTVATQTITIDELKLRMEQSLPTVIIDARNHTAWDLASTKVPRAIRVGDNEQLRTLVRTLPKSSFIVPYCT